VRRPRSARTRKRLIRAGLVVGLIAFVAVAVAVFPHAQKQVETFRDVPVDLPEPDPTPVKASPELRHLLIGETSEFVRTAVRRKDLPASWPLIHPELKQGLTRAEWMTGNIPVVPFPANAIVATQLDWSYENDVALDVVLQPEKKSGLYRKTFTIEFKRAPHGNQDRWLVSSWVPRGVSDALINDQHQAGVQAALQNVRGHQGLSATWAFLPVCLIAGVFLLPLFLVISERRRARRAEAAHQAALAARYSSSSRPS